MFLLHTLQPQAEPHLQRLAAGRCQRRPRAGRGRGDREQQHLAPVRCAAACAAAAAARWLIRSSWWRRTANPTRWALGHAGRYAARLPAGQYIAVRHGKELLAQRRHAGHGDRPAAHRHTTSADLAATGQRRLHGRGRQRAARHWMRASSSTRATSRWSSFSDARPSSPSSSRKGRLEVPIAPGAYGFTVSAGAGVLAPGRARAGRGGDPVQTAHCRVDITPAVRPAGARLVCRRPAPSRRSGRGGDAARGPRALAARGRSQCAVRQRP